MPRMTRMYRRSIIRTQWQLQEAENRFDEIVEEALTNGPQTMTRHGAQ